MKLYHLSVKYISRKQGQSVVASAAYRSGERLYDAYYGLVHDYTKKTGIVYTEILLPPNAPHRYYDRQTLWSAVDAAEKRIDSRTAREIEIALPNECTFEEHKELVRNYLSYFIDLGMCADVAFHHCHYNIENPHAHILLTTRPVGPEGFSSKKDRDWDRKENVSLWRKLWADAQNRIFERKRLDVRVSHESYKMQGLNREPTIHLGHRTAALEQRGIHTDRGNQNRDIRERNRERERQKQRHHGRKR
ncbi:MobA/MobL family protein [Lachnospiraceae bacterium ZAX-1]